MSADEIDRSALGRAAAARHRPARRARGVSDRSGLGDLASGLDGFAATVGRSRLVRRALTSVVGRGAGERARSVPALDAAGAAGVAGASVRAPRWWWPSADVVAAGGLAAAGAGGVAPGLARVVRRVPTESTYVPGGFSGRLTPRSVPMRLPAEVAAAGPMLGPQDQRRRSAPRAASAAASAAGPVAAEGVSRVAPSAGAVQVLRRAAAAAAGGAAARQAQIRRSVTRGTTRAPEPLAATVTAGAAGAAVAARAVDAAGPSAGPASRRQADRSSGGLTPAPTVGAGVDNPATSRAAEPVTVWRGAARENAAVGVATGPAVARIGGAAVGRPVWGRLASRVAAATVWRGAARENAAVGVATGPAVARIGGAAVGRPVWGRLASRVAAATVWRGAARENPVTARSASMGQPVWGGPASLRRLDHLPDMLTPVPTVGTAVYNPAPFTAAPIRRRTSRVAAATVWRSAARENGAGVGAGLVWTGAVEARFGSATAGRPVWGRLASRVAGATVWRSLARDDSGNPGGDPRARFRAAAAGPAAVWRSAAREGAAGVSGGPRSRSDAAAGPAESGRGAPVVRRLASRVAAATVRRSVARESGAGVRTGLVGTGAGEARFGSAAAGRPVWGRLATRVAAATVGRRLTRKGAAEVGGGSRTRPDDAPGSPVAGRGGAATAGRPGRMRLASPTGVATLWRSVARGDSGGPGGDPRISSAEVAARFGGIAAGRPVWGRVAAATVLRRVTGASAAGAAGESRISGGAGAGASAFSPRTVWAAAGLGSAAAGRNVAGRLVSRVGTATPLWRSVAPEIAAATGGGRRDRHAAAARLGSAAAGAPAAGRVGSSVGRAAAVSAAAAPAATVWRSVAAPGLVPSPRDPQAVTVGAERGAHELAPAVLGRVLPGGPTPLPASATTVFRTQEGAAPARGSVGRLVELFSPRPPGVLVGALTERVAPPRMSVAAPVATLDPGPRGATPAPPTTVTAMADAAAPVPGAAPAAPGAAAPALAPAPVDHADHGVPVDHAAPGGPAPANGAGGSGPPARWRITDLDPADLAELADLVMERIEGRVRGELERRGRRGIPGVF